MLKWAGPSTLKSINDPDHYDVFSYVSKYVLSTDEYQHNFHSTSCLSRTALGG